MLGKYSTTCYPALQIPISGSLVSKLATAHVQGGLKTTNLCGIRFVFPSSGLAELTERKSNLDLLTQTINMTVVDITTKESFRLDRFCFTRRFWGGACTMYLLVVWSDLKTVTGFALLASNFYRTITPVV